MSKQKPDLIDLKLVSREPPFKCPPGRMVVLYEGGPPGNKRSKNKTEIFGYAEGIKVLTYRQAYAQLETAFVSYRTFVTEIKRQRGTDLIPVMMFTPGGHCLISMCSEFKFGHFKAGSS